MAATSNLYLARAGRRCSMFFGWSRLAGRAHRGPDRCLVKGQKVAAFGVGARRWDQPARLALNCDCDLTRIWRHRHLWAD